MHEEMDRKPGLKEAIILAKATLLIFAALAFVFALGHYVITPLAQQAMNGFIALALARAGVS